MSQDTWSAVDTYFIDRLHASDDALGAALRDTAGANIPQINVAPNQGKFLHLLARIHGARRILEVGTLGGYSTIWLARALPEGGRLVSLELEPRHAEVARANIARAGLADRVEVVTGAALDTLDRLIAEGVEPFDLVFIDADKPNNPGYFSKGLALARPGGVIIVDNVARGGEVANPATSDASVKGVHAVTELIAAEPRVTATAIQTVGSKGYDGFILALVTG